MDEYVLILSLIIGYTLDVVFGDPSYLPHPVVFMGKAISFFEKRLNKGRFRMIKGGLSSIILIIVSYILAYTLINLFSNIYYKIAISSILIFYSLAGKTLVDEVVMVFKALNVSLENGRKQISRIVGRDTSQLSEEEIKTAALETLSENLNDGVVAPLFWLLIGGVPGMIAYKMINTQDSMIGYKNSRYRHYGFTAAKIDDIANYIPARLTAFLMILVYGKLNLFQFILKYGRKHSSPNSGYPESALAGILNCRFGGPHKYFGEMVYKPYIGYNERNINHNDMNISILINKKVGLSMVILNIVLLNLLS